MITKLLSTAVQLYLRSQVDHVLNLQVKIVGKNRQILTGYIPQVCLSCERGVYQGLFLRQVEVQGTNISFNLPEVLKKKPLRLLEPIVAEINLCLAETDLKYSLNSSLCQNALSDLWQIILSTQPATSAELPTQVIWHDIAIAGDQINLQGSYQIAGKELEINLSTAMTLVNNHTLCLFPLRITDELNIFKLIEKLEINLGTDVAIKQLVIKSEQIICSGTITINH